MDSLISALRLAEAVAESLPVPALSPVVKVSLEIATMAKEIKDTKDGMHSLAQYVARTTNAIYGTLDSFEDPRDAQINDRLDALLSTLQKIQAFMLRARDKNYLQRLWHKSEYEDQLTSLTKELEEAVETFQIQGSIRTEDQLCSVRRTQVVLLQHADDARRVDSELLRYFRNTETRLVQLSNQVANNATYDGTMRLFGRDDLELIEELDPESPIEESGERPVRYKARLRSSGSLVVVQRFPRSDDKFRDEVNIGKSIWHPNVAHPIGYSKSDPHTAFIVIDGSHTRTFNELSRTFHGADKMKWMMKAAKDTCAGLVYLSSVRDKLGWSPDDNMYPMLAEKELLVSVDGRVLLDPSCYRLDRLPNTIIYDDGMIELHTRGRELIKAFKFDVNVAPAQRYQYLQTLWRNFVEMADFSREDSMYWRSLRIPGPGEAFSLSSEETIPEIVYDDLVNTMTLVPEYSAPQFFPGNNAPSSPPPAIEHRVVVQRMSVDGGHVAKTPWRRYTVRHLEDGWTLETTTGVRESADCRGWFMNEAPHLCGLSDLLEDLAVAYALKFRTRTSLVKVSDDALCRKPPRNLYFYERVHDYPHASLDPKINWPWGFWSTDPNDQCDITEFHDAHLSLPSSHSIAFLGVFQDREFTWVQQLGSWMFYIQVCVEVEYYTLTSEECLVLQEMHRYSGDSDADDRFEDITDTDIIMGEAFGSEDEDTLMADDWSENSDDSDADEDEFDDWVADESRTAEGLVWLSGSSKSPARPREQPRANHGRTSAVCMSWQSWQLHYGPFWTSTDSPEYYISMYHGDQRALHKFWYGFGF